MNTHGCIQHALDRLQRFADDDPRGTSNTLLGPSPTTGRGCTVCSTIESHLTRREIGSRMSAKYVVYGNELSYFTRKLESALVFYGIDFERRWKDTENTREIEKRSGTHQIPVLRTPENWVIADTTPLLQLLDARSPERRLVPRGPAGVLVHVLEDYFDEWIARTMVHYRWHYPRSAEFASLRMAGGDQAAAAQLASWGPRACRATGTEAESQQRAAEAEYERILVAMEKQLTATPYLLGERPTAVDCIVLGGLRAHTHMDPDPKEVVAHYPGVITWCERRADTWPGTGDPPSLTEPSPFARFVLEEMATTYQPYILGNRAAQRAGEKVFSAEIYGEPVTYLSRPYPEQSRLMICERIRSQLRADEQEQVHAWLREANLEACFPEAFEAR